ncbi:YicC/YloC family endoribonuclease [secondary endosymbiont of Heteropsylla cubana]|nr:YicC/YloC family endoribonuclease [secondary endosymbiont of Heteropsylla cubana]
MIRSMMAYSCRDIPCSFGTTCWELRSINQRYLEICIRLPEEFCSFEPIIREHIRLFITRGRMECNLRVDINSEIDKPFIVNKKLAKNLLDVAHWLKKQSKEGDIDLLSILRWPGVVVAKKQNSDEISAELMSGFEAIFKDFISKRETGGHVFNKLIAECLSSIKSEITNVRYCIPTVLKWQRKKILNKLEEARVYLDVNRLEQELVICAQRIDVTEELDRLETHVNEIHNILIKEDTAGRRLDFMMQELNREANTLASKSININVTKSAIELKVLIEKMREYVQFIE